MSETNIDALSESLIRMQTELAAFGELYKSLDEAKLSLERSGEELKGRADDQWASTRDLVELIRAAVDGIEHSSKKAVAMSESITALVSEIGRVDFPQRLDSIDSRLHESSDTLTSLFSSIKTQVDWLKGELTPLARQLPTRVGELSKHLETVSGRVDSTNAAISIQASALSTLQSATIREFEGLRREIEDLSAASKDRHGALTSLLAAMRNQVENLRFSVYAVMGFVAVVIWKVW